jgi:hypothetical protein
MKVFDDAGLLRRQPPARDDPRAGRAVPAPQVERAARRVVCDGGRLCSRVTDAAIKLGKSAVGRLI